MFAYNPTVNDTSGQIIGQGMVGAAQTNADTMRQVGSDIGSVITQFAGAYAADKALQAKGAAYGDFMKRHGQQLGFDPGYLEDFLKRDPREQAMIGDNIIGMQNTGNRLMGLNYMNQQANLFSGNRGSGTGGGGGGASAPAATGGSSFTF
jgi:hypothetical protein